MLKLKLVIPDTLEDTDSITLAVTIEPTLTVLPS
jgi:hypothetical protein